jgi:hypothetical protein
MEDTEVSFQQKVGIESKEFRQRGLVLFFVGEEGRVDGTVHVLTEKHELVLNASSVHNRTRRMAGPVNGGHGAISHCEDRFFSAKFYIDGKRFHPCPIPGSSSYFAVTRLKVNRIQFVSHDTAPELIPYSFSSAGVVKVTMGEKKIFQLYILRQAFGDVFFQS